MSCCNHVTLVEVEGEKDIYDTGRFGRAINELPRPDEQYPSLVHFVGKKSKNLALKYLFPQNNIRRGASTNGSTNLRLDTTTIGSDRPLLFCDSDPFAAASTHGGWNLCHSVVAYPLSWAPTTEYTTGEVVEARLLFLFSDVICVFVDDFSGLDQVAERIVRWVRIGSASSHPEALRPRLILVVSEKTLDKSFSDLRLEEFRHELYERCEDGLAKVFSGVQVMQLGGDHLSPLARHCRLKDMMRANVSEMSNLRQKHMAAFSASHLKEFFVASVQHLAATVDTTLDFITTSRVGNEISGDLSYHLYTFLVLGTTYKIPYDQLASYISSALLMDAFPPGMHFFDIDQLFHQLYRNHCFDAFLKVGRSDSFAKYQCDQVQRHIAVLAEELQKGSIRSSHLHIANISNKHRHFSSLKSNVSCLYCLRRKPEHVLSCDHSVCEKCVRIFGIGVSGSEQRFMLTGCILCQNLGSLSVSLKPPTAGVRIMSIDGGGTRGVLPLQHMLLLQEAVGDCPLNDLFDLAVGTSSGGFIVLGLFSLGWDVKKCSATFDALARQVFGETWETQRTILGRAKELFSWWAADGKHDPNLLESTLQNHFGPTRRMFGSQHGRSSGPKVAVTATSISDATPFIFTNYNGVMDIPSDCGYRMIRPWKIDEEPFLWEAGRATSAAPLLYRPANITALGAFQDGGLKYNNPVNLALWESRRIWPESASPDIVLSFGTGTESWSRSSHAPHFRHILNDGFIPRTWRSFMSSLDGESTWKNLKNHLSEGAKTHFFRLNPVLPHDASIDDVSGMDALRRIVKKSDRCIEIARALLISNFYLELRAMPSYEAGQYRCHGTIRCRGRSYTTVQALKRLGLTRLQLVSELESLGSCALQRDICPLCHCYRWPVTFVVRHLDEPFSLYLREEGTYKRRLGGFPNNIRWFIKQQALNAKFGTADHGSMGQSSCNLCAKLLMTFEMRKRGCDIPLETMSKRPRLTLTVPQDVHFFQSTFT
ncbi:hypothetical protein EPUS_05719 [Endocarpon pusillum Z07020]|uniref:PNPLA domain-containing protein n=1 Tax=Endocarpon pusillum (strain Z07020 / HMAS-L-300199) TaxID=1263415 RepID=U1G9J1_ENDPU|nr:uncharacterized protein EPUS_05719 [Endocarpon pusillum Z07020]ERF68658.1 hypothetical protein EPUS_05719 [Endocarpon pusillum Z07020]